MNDLNQIATLQKTVQNLRLLREADAERTARLEAALKLTLRALKIFASEVAAKDMIVPMWVNDCIDELNSLKGGVSS